ncbi:tetratricopeptide repeat protein 13-like isoform X2 [Physella acuta]|uniref:tetratricopeptide repeat protein 13-like isoform X2 n=1 Tax=Physella acuta TaxID=109671 RepID=UPI0027DABF24|nr:tetratricopeptide repeat protein 13-like isoform X2 [Physella acuta]
MDVWLLSVFISVCMFTLRSNGQICKIANVQIDNEDGKQQYIELNLKKLDINDESICLGCNIKGDPSKTGGYDEYSSHHSHWTKTPPTFNIVFIPSELVPECDADDFASLPTGLCALTESDEKIACQENVCSLPAVEELAEAIEEKHFSSLFIGHAHLEHQLAAAVVHLNLGHADKAVEEFSSLIHTNPTLTIAYFGRGLAYARKNLQNATSTQLALNDLTKAIELDTSLARPDLLMHRTQVLLRLHQYQEALNDVTSLLKLQPSAKIYFLRGVIHLMMENFSQAEQDFRKNLLSSDAKIQSLSHFHLGLALYYRGKVRNAVEVFKEVLKENPAHLEACLSLAQGYKDLGNVRGALSKFNQSLHLNPNHAMTYNLRGNLFYSSGDQRSAILDYERCLARDPHNANCQYMKAASKLMHGRFYDALKDTTKLMVTNMPTMRASPEFLRAQYLREYARYVHARLDSPISSIEPGADFIPEYLNSWTKLKPLDLKSYKEQPGLRPDIRDADPQFEIPPALESLICRAEALGKLSQVNADGVLTDRRLNLAMGLASIHIGQYFEAKWKLLKAVQKPGTADRVVHSWRELFNIGVYYRRLASLDQPFLWVENLPDFKSKEGHKADIPFVRGSVTNLKMLPYFDLAFKLAKTMLEHYTGDGAVSYPGLAEDISKAETCEDLLLISRKRQINPRGFLVSTQVPSLHRGKVDYRLDGGVLVLTEDLQQRIVFAMNIVSTPDRTASYTAEMDHLLVLLQEEIRKSGLNKVSDVELTITHILSIVYYFYNLLPLTKGSSAVAYSVLMGLLLSVGRQVTGRIPNGRLLDMEAILAGAPDAFVMVAKNWMAIKKTTVPVSTLPKVKDLLPTVRSVLEILTVNTTNCLH